MAALHTPPARAVTWWNALFPLQLKIGGAPLERAAVEELLTFLRKQMEAAVEEN
jgi:hypothetical protein